MREDRATGRRRIVILAGWALLVVGSVVCWARSTWCGLATVRVWPGDATNRRWVVVVGSNQGSLALGLSKHTPVNRWVEFEQSYGPAGYRPFARTLGFWIIWETYYHSIFVPCWVMAAVSAGMCVRTWLRRPGTRPGCCARCGYDLRATPLRCPECGMDPATSAEEDEGAKERRGD